MTFGGLRDKVKGQMWSYSDLNHACLPSSQCEQVMLLKKTISVKSEVDLLHLRRHSGLETVIFCQKLRKWCPISFAKFHRFSGHFRKTHGRGGHQCPCKAIARMPWFRGFARFFRQFLSSERSKRSYDATKHMMRPLWHLASPASLPGQHRQRPVLEKLGEDNVHRSNEKTMLHKKTTLSFLPAYYKYKDSCR